MNLQWHDDLQERIACLEWENEELREFSGKNTEKLRKRDRELATLKKRFFFRVRRKLSHIKQRALRFLNRRIRKGGVRGISVVIPTYREGSSIYEAINSVLQQSFRNVEVILAVNGPDSQWYDTLVSHFEGSTQVRVVRTEIPGAAAGRNLGIASAAMDGIMFLDDDDRLSPGYLEALSKRLDASVEFVQGRVTEDLSSPKLSYIDKAVKDAKGEAKSKDPNKTTFLATVTGKLLRTDRMKQAYAPFDESLRACEDIDFWLRNYPKIQGKVAVLDFKIQEAYLRGKTQDSVSRPNSTERVSHLFSAYAAITRKAEDLIFGDQAAYPHKKFASHLIHRHTGTVSSIYFELSPEQKAAADAVLKENERFYLNKGFFSPISGIAFCHNFSPTIDPSAMVAPRRLAQVSELEGHPIRWTAISKDMSNIRSLDSSYSLFYSRFVYAKQIVVRGIASTLEENQYHFGRIAYQKARDLDASVIYSRSMFPGSHIAAYLYKQEHPDVKWYAEFSDPVLYDTTDHERPLEIPEDADDFLSDFWCNIEEMVYSRADVILFTNENQKRYMLSYNRTSVPNDLIEQKSLVSTHPVIDRRFTKILKSSYRLPAGINIAYFGSLPKYRNRGLLLQLCRNPRVHLHLFTVMTKDKSGLRHRRIHWNKGLDYLEFLNLASKMDYLIVMDSENVSEINPWLPSKVSDYIASGTPIIAVVREGSPLSGMTDPQFILRRDLDDDFIMNLSKKRSVK